MPEQSSDQDWGESAGARLAEAKEANSHKRFERQFQLLVLLLLTVTTLALVMVDVIWAKAITKEILVIILPAFTFVLGKLNSGDG